MIMDIIVCALLLCSLFFLTGGSVGILRFPDFYSRLHPAGKLDTLGSLLALIAFALFNLHHFSLMALLTSLKILLIFVFVSIASPTATHGIVDAGVRAGLAPWTKGQKRR
ncbi:MAG: sodium:proton antiporter [Deltaproteobacteria bacterium]|nr:MAG: sodium:proton antiporter [Deltaproteobacteria bacterium]